MNIEKIKNYNHKILAVLGTVLLLIAIISLILLTVFAIGELSRSSRYNRHDDGILSDEKIEELQKQNIRKQLISYETPKLVDSLNLIYMIPVTHKTLNREEFIEEEYLMELSSDYSLGKNYSQKYYGDFNNLLIYDYKNHNINKLFEDRVNFESIQTEYFSDEILILFKASTKDTYKDGIINQLDHKTLFIYSLTTKDLKEIKLENADISEVDFVESSKDLILKFGIDHNKDGKFDEYSEPTVIKKYDYENGELIDIISQDINIELQKKLEGTK